MQYKQLTDEKSICNAIEQFHSEFLTLSERVDLKDYSNKLAQHAFCELMLKDTEAVGIVAIVYQLCTNKNGIYHSDRYSQQISGKRLWNDFNEALL